MITGFGDLTHRKTKQKIVCAHCEAHLHRKTLNNFLKQIWRTRIHSDPKIRHMYPGGSEGSRGCPTERPSCFHRGCHRTRCAASPFSSQEKQRAQPWHRKSPLCTSTS